MRDDVTPELHLAIKRMELNVLDGWLADLIERRFKTVAELLEWKRTCGLKLVDEERERYVVSCARSSGKRVAQVVEMIIRLGKETDDGRSLTSDRPDEP